jgi:hypothetical protein
MSPAGAPAFLACLLLLPQAAEAAHLCHPFSEFGKPMKRCEDNYVLGSEALTCVERFYKYVQDGKLTIKKDLDQQVARMRKQQSDSYDRADTGYKHTQQILKALIAEGEYGKSVVDGYFDELFFPEDWDEPSVTGMSTAEYLAKEPCFAIPKSVIGDSQKMIAKIIADLGAVDLSSGTKQQTSATRSEHGQSLTGGAVAKTKGQAAPKPVPAGKTPPAASDITGSGKAIDEANKAKARIQRPNNK